MVLFTYLVAVVVALIGFWALVKFARSRQDWFSDEPEPQPRARLMWENNEPHDPKVASLKQPSAKGFAKTGVHRMPPKNGAA